MARGICSSELVIGIVVLSAAASLVLLQPIIDSVARSATTCRAGG